MCFGSGGGSKESGGAPSPYFNKTAASVPSAQQRAAGGSVGGEAQKTGLLSNGSATDPAKPKTLLGG